MDLKKNKVRRTFERTWREEREGQRCDYTIILKIKTNKNHVGEIEQVTIIPTQKETSQTLRFGVTFRQFHFYPHTYFSVTLTASTEDNLVTSEAESVFFYGRINNNHPGMALAVVLSKY